MGIPDARLVSLTGSFFARPEDANLLRSVQGDFTTFSLTPIHREISAFQVPRAFWIYNFTLSSCGGSPCDTGSTNLRMSSNYMYVSHCFDWLAIDWTCSIVLLSESAVFQFAKYSLHFNLAVKMCW